MSREIWYLSNLFIRLTTIACLLMKIHHLMLSHSSYQPTLWSMITLKRKNNPSLITFFKVLTQIQLKWKNNPTNICRLILLKIRKWKIWVLRRFQKNKEENIKGLRYQNLQYKILLLLVRWWFKKVKILLLEFTPYNHLKLTLMILVSLIIWQLKIK